MKSVGPLTPEDIAKAPNLIDIRQYDTSDPQPAADALVKLLTPRPSADTDLTP
jgi:hypothetical protein